MSEAGTTPQWGYSKTDAKIFDLKPGESLPDGFFAHPAMIRGSAADKQMLADAEKEGLTGHQFQQPEDPKPQAPNSGRRG